jgi:ubiquinone biosynthesis protein Coq4
MRAWLESPVREAAVVYVNGQRVGSVWHAPYEIEIGALLHAGENNIRIVVANLAINEMSRDPLPDYKLLNGRYGERFQPQDLLNLQPLPAGLLGPVRLKWMNADQRR